MKGKRNEEGKAGKVASTANSEEYEKEEKGEGDTEKEQLLSMDSNGR